MIARLPGNPEQPRRVRGFSFSGGADSRLAVLLGIPLGILYVLGILSLRTKTPFTDEADHFGQIALFLRDRWQPWPSLTTIPGYHVVSALLLRLSGSASLDAARLIGAAWGLLAIAGFHALRRQLWPGTQTLGTAQFALLPILAPLYFLVYTDVAALALLLWASWAAVARRSWLSAMLLTLLVGVRQHEIVWIGLVAPLAVWSSSQVQPGSAVRIVMRYLLPAACFVAFWIWNGSISLSHEQSGLHPDLSLHAGNLFVAALVAGLLLPLHALAGFAAFIARARRAPWLALVPVALACAFWFGLRADNLYNTAFPSYYLHNGLVAVLEPRGAPRALAAGIFAVSCCGLAQMRLRPPVGWLLWPVAALFLGASWLVELRYALVPLALWLALREPMRARIEYATLALWVLLAVWICHATATHRLFL